MITIDRSWSSHLILASSGATVAQNSAKLGAQMSAADWIRGNGALMVEIELPAARTGDHCEIVPALSNWSGERYGYQAELAVVFEDGERHEAALTPVGEGCAGESRSTARLVADVDTFIVKGRIRSAGLRVTVVGERGAPNGECLLSAALRSKIDPAERRTVAPSTRRIELAVPSFSQMTIPEIGRRICSPTCVAMVVSACSGRAVSPQEAAAVCFCPAHDLYGVWPWAVYGAARLGVAGALRFFSDWSEVLPILEAGIPVIASIRYGKGEIAGVALERESEKPSGHLIVIRGLDGERVLVNDPGAASESTVPREYRLSEISTTWFNRSGMGYLLLPSS